MKTIKMNVLVLMMAFSGVNTAMAQFCDPTTCAATKNGLSYNAEKVSNSVIINKSAEEVWAKLAQLDDLESLAPGLLTHSKISGDGMAKEGCTRICTTVDGQKVSETITELDHKKMFYAYQINEGVPAKMTNSLQVISLGENRSKVVWNSRYEYIKNDQVNETDFAQFVENAGKVIMDGLRTYFA